MGTERSTCNHLQFAYAHLKRTFLILTTLFITAKENFTEVSWGPGKSQTSLWLNRILNVPGCHTELPLREKEIPRQAASRQLHPLGKKATEAGWQAGCVGDLALLS